MKYLKYFESKKETIYLFLDIDGVFITFDEVSNHRYFDEDEKWSKEAIKNLNSLYEKFNPTVVIISSYCNEKSIKDFQKRFKEMGFTGKISDKLKNQKSDIRFSLVKKVIKKNDKFIIIDDMEHDIKDVPELKNNWCQPDSSKGFTKKDLEKCLNMI